MQYWNIGLKPFGPNGGNKKAPKRGFRGVSLNGLEFYSL